MRRYLAIALLALSASGVLAQSSEEPTDAPAADEDAEACADDRLGIRQGDQEFGLTVEVVDTPQSRSIGLMFRPELAPDAGMLFVYGRPQTVSFYMKNTLIPLDMLFANAEGVVQHIHANAVPLDETPIPGGSDIQFVLEIPGGRAAELGLAPGAEMRHPAIVSAAWACD